MPSFADFLDCLDLVFYMLYIVDPYTLYRLRAISRPLRKAVDRYLTSAFDLDRFLQERFVENPTAFRGMMGRTSSIISGLTALEFFARARWEDTPLEIFVNRWNVERLCRVLVHTTNGYSYVPGSTTPGVASFDDALLPATWARLTEEEALPPSTIVAGFEFRRMYRDKWRRVLVFSPSEGGTMEAVIHSYPTSKLNRAICMTSCTFYSLFSLFGFVVLQQR